MSEKSDESSNRQREHTAREPIGSMFCILPGQKAKLRDRPEVVWQEHVATSVFSLSQWVPTSHRHKVSTHGLLTSPC